RRPARPGVPHPARLRRAEGADRRSPGAGGGGGDPRPGLARRRPQGRDAGDDGALYLQHRRRGVRGGEHPPAVRREPPGAEDAGPRPLPGGALDVPRQRRERGDALRPACRGRRPARTVGAAAVSLPGPVSAPESSPAWHAMEPADVLQAWEARPEGGLTAAEVSERRGRGGPNPLREGGGGGAPPGGAGPVREGAAWGVVGGTAGRPPVGRR